MLASKIRNIWSVPSAGARDRAASFCISAASTAAIFILILVRRRWRRANSVCSETTKTNYLWRCCCCCCCRWLRWRHIESSDFVEFLLTLYSLRHCSFPLLRMYFQPIYAWCCESICCPENRIEFSLVNSYRKWCECFTIMAGTFSVSGFCLLKPVTVSQLNVYVRLPECRTVKIDRENECVENEVKAARCRIKIHELQSN